MASEDVEVEKKYDVGEDAEVPDLTELPGVARAGDPRVDTLEAVYFDTGRHTLAARGVTLRRRTGGADAGWHLKLPPEFVGGSKDADPKDAGSASAPQRRRELRAPLGQPDVVPDSLLAYVLAYLRGDDPAPVARLETHRTTHPLYGDDGVHLADLADDRVSAHILEGGAPPAEEAKARRWREWELELVHGSPDLFPAAAGILAAAGASPAGHRSKLAKALEGSGTEETRDNGVSAPAPKPPRKKGPVSDLLTAYLAEQIREILAHDPGVRLEQPEAVHDLRSATRRARSALAAYRRIYSAVTVRRLRDELKWLGGMLGSPRDAEVMLDRLRGHAAELPPGPVSKAAADRLEEELGNTLDTGYRKLQKTLLTERYFRLLDDLEAFRDHPPTRPDGAAPARKAAAKLAGKAAKRLQRAARTAKRARRGTQHETALHQVRKDAKRLRHVAESIGPVHGKRARKIAKAAHRQQKILGDFQDSVVSRDVLAKLAAAPDLPESIASAYLTLHTRQVQLAAEAEAKYWKARKKSRTILQRGVI
ncbi:CYTH and CHAD domain-containing protein [Pseudarthrobacter sulfonivorans]|uniref:CYTH and CHAD domain-containing protein n=1 Tax=Pseudarthrobacter sulfonivorans TaxID=121292 RepID=UPI0028589237|nr:CYTH and CHAD domain-containing protein [Pseudarthrobacter sulfonivorans]MDR6413408.1 CHAD domain-containing protein [Pseudarthrobacter sulfonivorans]